MMPPALLVRMILGACLQPALLALLLFYPPARFGWWRAWILIGVFLAATLVSMVVLARTSPALLAERFKPPLQRGQPRADKIAVLVFIATFLGAIRFVPIDVFRLRLLPPPGPVVAVVGLALLVAGWWLVTAALRANAFAVPVVKRQDERHQRVVDHGPYAVVRHPMYAGIALVLLGIPLWLESTAGAVAACVPILVLVVRIAIEERFLRRELRGYEEYAARVGYRLIPKLW